MKNKSLRVALLLTLVLGTISSTALAEKSDVSQDGQHYSFEKINNDSWDSMKEKKHEEKDDRRSDALLVSSVFPSDKSNGVRPDSPITLILDGREKGKDFEKGRYQVFLNKKRVTTQYSSLTRTITVPHQLLERYTSYNVLVQTEKKSYSLGFATGSSIGEATHIKAQLQSNNLKITEIGKVHVMITDDYGLPASQATVIVSGSNIIGSSRQLSKADNGECDLTFYSDKQQSGVYLTIKAEDATYSDDVDKNQLNVGPVDFYADPVDHIYFSFNDPYLSVNQHAHFIANAYDDRGNVVPDGTVVSLSSTIGTVTDVTSTINGVFSFNFYSNEAGNGYFLINGKIYDKYGLQIFSRYINSITYQVFTDPREAYLGHPVEVELTATDKFGAPFINARLNINTDEQRVPMWGSFYSLPSIIITDENGKARFSIQSDLDYYNYNANPNSPSYMYFVNCTFRIEMLDTPYLPSDFASVWYDGPTIKVPRIAGS